MHLATLSAWRRDRRWPAARRRFASGFDACRWRLLCHDHCGHRCIPHQRRARLVGRSNFLHRCGRCVIRSFGLCTFAVRNRRAGKSRHVRRSGLGVPLAFNGKLECHLERITGCHLDIGYPTGSARSYNRLTNSGDSRQSEFTARHAMLTRRHLIRTSSALFSGPLAGVVWAQSDEAVDAVTTDTAGEEPPARKPISDRSMWSRHLEFI